MAESKGEPRGERYPDGLYERLLTNGLNKTLGGAVGSDSEAVRESLELGTSDRHLSQHLLELTVRVLSAVPRDERPRRQVEIYNLLVDALRQAMPEAFDADDDRLPPDPELLLELHQRRFALGEERQLTRRPTIPLSQSALLVNGPHEPSIGVEIGHELASADRVDLLCAFLKWHGVRYIRDPLETFLGAGRELRVITTTYMGATERRALDELAKMGAKIAVSYDNRSTRLHAKAWLFHRRTGFSTAYVGSSNLSRAALHDGLEWNVRVSAIDMFGVLKMVEATFAQYWLNPEFERYVPDRDAERFDQAVRAQRSGRSIDTAHLEVHPYSFQQEILDRLQVERERHNRWRNLVVAATGTGKTVIAALDYRRLTARWPKARLLFVAHRKEILQQSLAVFRAVLHDQSFGELYVGGEVPTQGLHVFASIQSLHAAGYSRFPKDQFDVVIIDEFHHAEAQTYRELLNHLTPRSLLGLTATPERADGRSVTEWFDGRIAVQLRLWEAIQRGLLCPFQYFGIADNVDLQRVRWTRGGYDVNALEGLYTGNDVRLRLVLDALKRQITDPLTMRAIGFCVSVAHANYMAEGFRRAGIPSVAVSADTPWDEREAALRRLAHRELNAVFAVDLFNEGVDVPGIDTVLFLRPTESATVFLQQLGRGLRRADEKSCLTVLDFIGQQHEKFRFELRLRALGISETMPLIRQIEAGLPFLPAGCQIILDRVSRERVLENIKNSLRRSRSRMVEELRRLGDLSLGKFLSETGIEPEELYRAIPGGWMQLRREAELPVMPAGPSEEKLQRALARMLHIDDDERLDLYATITSQTKPPALDTTTARQERLLTMLHFSLWGGDVAADLSESLRRLWACPNIRAELCELMQVLKSSTEHLPMAFKPNGASPLWLHCRYSRDEALAALGLSSVQKPRSSREGVVYAASIATDAFFITRNKSESDFSPSTMYEDYAISKDTFHWQSQSTTSETSPTGRRYIEHEKRSSEVLLFAREDTRNLFGARPYMFLGPASYVSHTGSRPMSITWRLVTPMPADVFEDMRGAGG